MMLVKAINDIRKMNEVVTLSSSKYKSIINIEGSWNINEVRPISKGCHSKKLYMDGKIVRFFVSMEPGATLETHWHEEVEIGKVLAGQIRILEQKQRYTEGQQFEINPLEVHTIENTSKDNYAFLLVDFDIT